MRKRICLNIFFIRTYLLLNTEKHNFVMTFFKNNKAMRKKSILFLLITVSLFFFSCRYDEGPMISFRTVENRVAQSFELVEFTKNEQNLTSLLNDSCGDYFRFFGSDVTYLESTFIIAGSVHQDDIDYWEMTGGWSLNSNNKHISINMGSNNKYIGLEPFQNSIYTSWKIHRLTKDEFWLSTNYNNSDYYLKLKKYEKE